MQTDLHDLFPDTKSLDQKSVTALLKSIKNSYHEGSFDYLKFKQSVLSLAKLNMDEATSFKSAFATAQTMGLSKESLIKSANKYIYALEGERESFAEALLKQKEIKVDGRRSEVEKLHDKIASHKQKIKELEREIEIFQQRIDNVDQDVDDAKAKIEGTKRNFLSVYEVISKAIKSDIELITIYL